MKDLDAFELDDELMEQVVGGVGFFWAVSTPTG